MTAYRFGLRGGNGHQHARDLWPGRRQHNGHRHPRNAALQIFVNGVDFQDNNVISNLTGGDYTLTIKDANGFISTIPVTVGRACITITLQPVNPTCNQSNGRISVTAGEAVAPFTYSKDGVSFFAENVFDNLRPANIYNGEGRPRGDQFRYHHPGKSFLRQF